MNFEKSQKIEKNEKITDIKDLMVVVEEWNLKLKNSIEVFDIYDNRQNLIKMNRVK